MLSKCCLAECQQTIRDPKDLSKIHANYLIACRSGKWSRTWPQSRNAVTLGQLNQGHEVRCIEFSL